MVQVPSLMMLKWQHRYVSFADSNCLIWNACDVLCSFQSPLYLVLLQQFCILFNAPTFDLARIEQSKEVVGVASEHLLSATLLYLHCHAFARQNLVLMVHR